MNSKKSKPENQNKNSRAKRTSIIGVIALGAVVPGGTLSAETPVAERIARIRSAFASAETASGPTAVSTSPAEAVNLLSEQTFANFSNFKQTFGNFSNAFANFGNAG